MTVLLCLTACVSKKRYIDLQKKHKTLSQELKSIQKNGRDLENYKKEVNSLRLSLNEKESQIKKLNNNLEDCQKKDASQVSGRIATIKQKLTQAKLSPEKNSIRIFEKDQKLYLSVSNHILFGPGSDKVDQKGLIFLQEFARLLKDEKNIRIRITGHTDNTPISNSRFTDNWQLSTARSLSVVRQLVIEGIAANILTAAGRGEFSPLKSNDTPEGRAQNRRTDFVISIIRK